MKTWLFWIFWIIDALVASVFIYFFFYGLGDGTVSSDNIVLWIGILGLFAGVLGSSVYFLCQKCRNAALFVVTVLRAPSILAGLFLLVVVMSGERMN